MRVPYALYQGGSYLPREQEVQIRIKFDQTFEFLEVYVLYYCINPHKIMPKKSIVYGYRL